MSKKYFIIIFVVLAALAAIDLSVRVFLKAPATGSETVVINDNAAPAVPATIAAKFFCANGKTVNAIFENAPKNQVSLDLSDGRKIILPHAISADGARYANADESFVFWNKGNGAFIQENGQETFSACTAT